MFCFPWYGLLRMVIDAHLCGFKHSKVFEEASVRALEQQVHESVLLFPAPDVLQPLHNKALHLMHALCVSGKPPDSKEPPDFYFTEHSAEHIVHHLVGASFHGVCNPLVVVIR